MLDQTTITFFTTIGGFIIGIGSTVITSILPNYTTKKAEKEKLFLEKCEELYTQSLQVKKAIDKNFEVLWTLYETSKEYPGTIDRKTPECPIDKVVLLAIFYAPSLKNISKRYSDNVRKVQTVIERFWEPIEDDDYLMEITELYEHAQFANLIRDASKSFYKTHEELSIAIEELVYKHAFKR